MIQIIPAVTCESRELNLNERIDMLSNTRWILLLLGLLLFLSWLRKVEGATPNIYTSVQTGTVQGEEVVIISMMQDIEEGSYGFVASFYQEGQPLVFQQGTYLSDNPPNLVVLQAEDLLDPSSMDNLDYLLHTSGEPFVHNKPFLYGDTFYLGLIHPGSSYGWVQVRSLGDGIFEQERSAVAYSGEVLRVGDTYGDFDKNGVTNGRDFLVWQQQPDNHPLDEWYDNYDDTGPPVLSVPERSTNSLLIVLTIWIFIFILRKKN